MSKQRLVKPEVRFQRNATALIELFSDSIQDLDEDIDMINLNLASAYIEHAEKKLLIESFVANTKQHWENLRVKNNDFLVDNLLNLAPERYKKKLKPYFVTLIDPESKKLKLSPKKIEESWVYTHNMIKCAIIYSNTTKDKDEAILLAKTWNVDLNKKVYEAVSDSEESYDSD